MKQIDGKWYQIERSEKFGLCVYALTAGRGYATGINHWKMIEKDTPLYKKIVDRLSASADRRKSRSSDPLQDHKLQREAWQKMGGKTP